MKVGFAELFFAIVAVILLGFLLVLFITDIPVARFVRLSETWVVVPTFLRTISPPRGAHHQIRNRFLDCEVRSLDIDVELLVEKALLRLSQGCKFCYAGIDEQNVDLAKLLLDGT